MTPRLFLPLVLAAGTCIAQGGEGPTDLLKAELKENYRYSPPVPAGDPAPVAPLQDESVERLEPFTVTALNYFEKDVLEAARRASDARDAAKFSPLRGGLILEKQFGPLDLTLGIWPTLTPYTEDITRSKGMKLSVDVIRINW